MTDGKFTYPTPRELREAYAAHGGEVETTSQLAALSGLRAPEIEAILNNPEKFAELEAYRAAYEMKGKHLPGRVLKQALRLMDVIEKHIDGGCDIDAALEIIKPLIRLMEVAERTRLAEKDSGDRSKLAVVHINISGPRAAKEAQTLKDVSGVIDVQAVQIPASAGAAL